MENENSTNSNNQSIRGKKAKCHADDKRKAAKNCKINNITNEHLQKLIAERKLQAKADDKKKFIH